MRTIVALCSMSLVALVLLSCSSGSTTTGTTPPVASTVPITGVVAAPGGTLAKPVARFLAQAKTVFAAAGTVSDDNPGVTPVSAGMTVNLIQIDSTGAQVGAPLATTTTDSNGNYTLNAPAGFTPGPGYVVQAEVTSGTTLESFVTSTTVTVDPYTHATVALVTGSISSADTPLSTITPAAIAAVQQTVLTNAGNVTTAAASSATTLATALQQTVKNDVEANNVVTSIAAAGAISGTVLDPAGSPVAGIQILVRTFGNQLTMATTRTAGDGSYTVHVPAGDYIVGAMNDTTASTAASAWWTGQAGGASSMFKAAKVTVGNIAVTANFNLIAGGRMSGTAVGNDTGNGIAGLQVSLCDFASGQTLMFVNTLPDGTMTFNVTPGTYYVSIRNSTLQPYATANISDAAVGGGVNKTQASPIAIHAGDSIGGTIRLTTGTMVSGTVSDPVSGPVAGIPVRFQDSTAGGAGAESVRTKADGSYVMWLQPGHFNILCRGQMAGNVDTTGNNVTVNFTAAVGQLTGTLHDGTGNPVSQATVYLYDNTGATPSLNMLGQEISNADGTFTVYTANPTASVKMGFTIDDGEFVGSSVYNGTTTAAFSSLTAAASIAAPTPGSSVALGTIALPAGVIFSGNINRNGAPAPNTMVQIRVGGLGGGARMVNTRTMKDGSYQITLPAGGIIQRACAFDINTSCPGSGTGSGIGTMTPGTANTYAFFDNIALGSSGATVTQNFAY